VTRRIRCTFVAIVALAFLSAPSAAPPRSLTVSEAIALYAQGNFTSAIRDLSTNRLTVTAFTNAIDAWMAAGDSTTLPRRKVVGAAFALDAIWAATRGMWNDGHSNRDLWGKLVPSEPERVLVLNCYAQGLVVRWVTRQLPASGAPEALEQLLWLTAIGVAEDGHAWHLLEHDILPVARKRLPAEPRFRLADVLARTNSSLGSLRLTSTRRNDILRQESLPSSVTRRIPNAVREIAKLKDDPALVGEAEVRMGYLELRRKDWAKSLAHLDIARSTATEPTLLAATDYFAGWIHEQQQRSDEAIAAYRRAVKITPAMRNLATRLSAQLFLVNERTEAYEILDPALNARPAPLDLLVAVERADARFVPEWLQSIRKALQ